MSEIEESRNLEVTAFIRVSASCGPHSRTSKGARIREIQNNAPEERGAREEKRRDWIDDDYDICDGIS